MNINSLMPTDTLAKQKAATGGLVKKMGKNRSFRRYDERI